MIGRFVTPAGTASGSQWPKCATQDGDLLLQPQLTLLSFADVVVFKAGQFPSMGKLSPFTK